MGHVNRCRNMIEFVTQVVLQVINHFRRRLVALPSIFSQGFEYDFFQLRVYVIDNFRRAFDIAFLDPFQYQYLGRVQE